YQRPIPHCSAQASEFRKQTHALHTEQVHPHFAPWHTTNDMEHSDRGLHSRQNLASATLAMPDGLGIVRHDPPWNFEFAHACMSS
ncbi:MAG: hypothetical protein ACI8UD_003293, partial [Planctomycetota bacterium]